MTWTVVSAVNNEEVLRSCLLSSPDIQSASEVLLQRGFSSAATAYNAAIQKATTDLLVFVHQDVYLPKNWFLVAEKALEDLTRRDPDWAVAGVFGIGSSGQGVGHLYCGAIQKVLGPFFKEGMAVRSLDEVLLILRKSSGLSFDERLHGFHLYGADLCMEAQRRGLKSYAIPAFCVHNTNGYGMLPLQFWQSYLFMRRKWKAELPLTTTCTTITFGCWPIIYWNLGQARRILLRGYRAGKRVPDPARLYRDLVLQGAVSPA